MTKQKFYKELKKIAPLFKWVENTKGHIRAIDIKNHHYCPLTALHFVRTGERVNITEGLVSDVDFDTAKSIVEAADNKDKKEKAVLKKVVGLK